MRIFGEYTGWFVVNRADVLIEWRARSSGIQTMFFFPFVSTNLMLPAWGQATRVVACTVCLQPVWIRIPFQLPLKPCLQVGFIDFGLISTQWSVRWEVKVNWAGWGFHSSPWSNFNAWSKKAVDAGGLGIEAIGNYDWVSCSRSLHRYSQKPVGTNEGGEGSLGVWSEIYR